MLALLLLITPPTGHTENYVLPDLGDSSLSEFSADDEDKAVRSIRREIYSEPTVVDDAEIQDYVDNLVARLTRRQFERPLNPFVIDEPAVNAFATLGGYIGIFAGLIEMTQSESELASVLAHELSHISQHHLTRQMAESRQITWVTLATMLAAVFASRSGNGQLTSAALATGQAGAAQAELAYSRDFEREADRLGIALLADAGFDTRAMPTLFQRMLQQQRAEERTESAYLRTHPLTIERIADMASRIEGIGVSATPPTTSPTSSQELPFALVKAKLKLLNASRQAAETLIREEAERRHGSPSQGTDAIAWRYLQALHAYRRGEFAASTKLLALLPPEALASPMIRNLKARLLLLNDPAAAIATMRRSYLAAPNELGAALTLVDALTSQGQAAEAIRMLEKLCANKPDDVALRRRLAKSYAEQNRQAMQHYVLADIQRLFGDYTAAVSQLDLAHQAGDADFYEQAMIVAKRREILADHPKPVRERRERGDGNGQ